MNQSIRSNNNELWINGIKVDPAPCGNICMVNGKTTSGDYVLVGTKWVHKKDAPKETIWKRLKSLIINTEDQNTEEISYAFKEGDCARISYDPLKWGKVYYLDYEDDCCVLDGKKINPNWNCAEYVAIGELELCNEKGEK